VKFLSNLKILDNFFFDTLSNRLLKYPAQDIIVCNPIQFLDYLEADQQ